MTAQQHIQKLGVKIAQLVARRAVVAADAGIEIDQAETPTPVATEPLQRFRIDPTPQGTTILFPPADPLTIPTVQAIARRMHKDGRRADTVTCDLAVKQIKSLT